jgi:cysteine-rich repeat protein
MYHGFSFSVLSIILSFNVFVTILQQPLLVSSIPALSMSFAAGMQQGIMNEYGVVYNISRDWMAGSSFMNGRDPRLGAGRLHNTSTNAAWMPTANTPYEYLEIKFPGPTEIEKLLLQGSEKSDGGNILSFNIHWSENGEKYYIYKRRDKPITFKCKNKTSSEDIIFNETIDTTIEKGYPLRGKYFRIVPQTWNISIAIRVEYIRKVVCGDGFTDFLEECDDTNILSGDGCSGYDAKHIGVPLGPCSVETETIQTDLAGTRFFVTGYKTTSVAPQTFGRQKIINQCNPSADCFSCTQLYTTTPRSTRDTSTLEYYQDPNYIQYCAGQKPAALINPDDPPDISLTRNDDGQHYRTSDPRAQTNEHGFHSMGLEQYTELPFD